MCFEHMELRLCFEPCVQCAGHFIGRKIRFDHGLNLAELGLLGGLVNAVPGADRSSVVWQPSMPRCRLSRDFQAAAMSASSSASLASWLTCVRGV